MLALEEETAAHGVVSSYESPTSLPVMKLNIDFLIYLFWFEKLDWPLRFILQFFSSFNFANRFLIESIFNQIDLLIDSIN